MSTLQQIVEERLRQLGLGAVEAATAAGIERTYIRDIVEGKKKSVRSDKMPDLARALSLDRDALARGELLPLEAVEKATSEKEEFYQLFSQADEESKGLAKTILRRGRKSGENSKP